MTVISTIINLLLFPVTVTHTDLKLLFLPRTVISMVIKRFLKPATYIYTVINLLFFLVTVAADETRCYD